MSDVNVLVVSGRLTKDAVVKTLPTGSSLIEFSIANNTGFGKYERVQYFDCKSFTKQATSLAPYLLKGKPVALTGRYETEKWVYNGVEQTKNYFTVNDIVLMPDGKGKVDGPSEVVKEVDAEPVENKSGTIW